jgi:poly-gamma-glutamate synthesis protein (capsule biosynthesis protein)
VVNGNGGLMISVLAGGDTNFPDPDWGPYVAGVRDTLGAADVSIGHVEIPYTLRPARTGVNVPRENDPEHLCGFVAAGFDLATLAGNHIWDAGRPGIEDTINWLDANRIPRTGAGLDLEDASRPAFIASGGGRIGVLSYCTTGPRDGWATRNKPGTAHVHVITHYELDHDCPGGAPTVYTFPTYPAVARFMAEIAAARSQCDFLVVALHKGILHTPVELADFESPLSHAAIDAGADMVIGHHAHILKAIEIYRGRPIYHGLGNCIFPAFAPRPDLVLDQHPHSFAARRTRLYRFEPLSARFPFHPDAQYSMLAQCLVEDGALARAGYIPVLIDAQGRPRTVRRDEGGQDVFDYVAKITAAAGFQVRFEWDGDTVVLPEAAIP